MPSVRAPAPTIALENPASPAVPQPLSRRLVVVGRLLGAVGVAFLLFDASLKVLQHPAAVEATVALGFSAEVVAPLGWVQLACLLLYLMPRTSVLGAVLWTGYLGGAVATHVRLGHPLGSHALFPIYVAAVLWVSLACRDRRVRVLLGKPPT